MFSFTYIVDSAEREISDRDTMLEEALARLSAGDEQALADIYQLTRVSIYGFALSLLKNSYDAEDVMQDCYVAVFEHAKDYKPHGKPLAWMLTITRNFALKRLKSFSKIVEKENFESYAEDKDIQINPNEQRLIINEMMDILADEERQIVILHAVTGMKHRQIAQLLELPLSTVLSKYNRALKKIRNSFQETDS